MARLKRDVLPLLGGRPIRRITLSDVLAALRLIETRGALEICRRAKQNISQIFRFASADEFEELAGEQPLWRIPAARMKMRRDHLVPLSREAADIVHASLGERDDGYVFSDDGQTPISQNRMIGALYRLGYRGRQTVHGFRGLASTWANEALKETADPRNPVRRYDCDWIEWQFAHVETNGVRRAYNAAQYLVPRRYMLQDWADLSAKSGF